nr:uncharacterized protein LOC108170061 [Malus domestica]
MLKEAQAWKSWAQIPEETKELVQDKLTCLLRGDLSKPVQRLEVCFSQAFQLWDDPEIARLQGCPAELKDRLEDWEWLCKYFTDPKFVKKSVAGKKARDSKTLLHHSGSKPFSYRLEARRQGSKFLQIDLFKDVYIRPGKEIAEQLLEKSTAILQEATSQLPPETSIEDVIVPEDADLKIVTEVLDQKLGRCHGKVVRCMGKAGVRETGASSSISSTLEVNSLKEEVTTLRGQLVAQNERMNMIVQALAMSGLQISMPEPNLAPPSTSQPLRPADT